MDFKDFLVKVKKCLSVSVDVQPKIKIDFETWESQLKEPMKKAWEQFESEFGESFINVETQKWGDEVQTMADLDFNGLKISIEGARYKNPDYHPEPEKPYDPQQNANESISYWLGNGSVFENASRSKLRLLLVAVQEALGKDTLVKPDMELINAVNRLTVALLDAKQKL